MSDEPAELGLITRQQRRILDELGTIRDDLAVLTAIAMRQDGMLTRLLEELRAMHAQHSRLANRVRELEKQGGESE